jgi:hypothetical protein
VGRQGPHRAGQELKNRHFGPHLAPSRHQGGAEPTHHRNHCTLRNGALKGALELQPPARSSGIGRPWRRCCPRPNRHRGRRRRTSTMGRSPRGSSWPSWRKSATWGSAMGRPRAGRSRPKRDRPALCAGKAAARERDTRPGGSGVAAVRRGRQAGIWLGDWGRPVQQECLSDHAEQKSLRWRKGWDSSYPRRCPFYYVGGPASGGQPTRRFPLGFRQGRPPPPFSSFFLVDKPTAAPDTVACFIPSPPRLPGGR